jgi:hypothetical protein
MLQDRKSIRPAELVVAFHTVAVFTFLAFSCSSNDILTRTNNAPDESLVKIPPVKCQKQAYFPIM